MTPDEILDLLIAPMTIGTLHPRKLFASYINEGKYPHIREKMQKLNAEDLNKLRPDILLGPCDEPSNRPSVYKGWSPK